MKTIKQSMATTFLLLLLVIPSSLCLCSWNSPAGKCAGPLARTLAVREDVNHLNHGCPMNSVYYHVEQGNQTHSNSNPGSLSTSCGECIPGSHGNWRFEGKSATKMTKKFRVESCREDNTCRTVDISKHNTAFFCNTNEYCNDQGKCKKMENHATFMNSCRDSSECGPGLQCARHRCLICLQDKRGPLSSLPTGIPSYCSNGKRVSSPWDQVANMAATHHFFVIIGLSVTGTLLWLPLIGKFIRWSFNGLSKRFNTSQPVDQKSKPLLNEQI